MSFFFAAYASGASFDCRSARTPVETLICEDATLSKMDDELSLNYNKALNSLDDNYKNGFLIMFLSQDGPKSAVSDTAVC